MEEYLCGNIFGISQVIIGYPFDTLKTNIQNNQSITHLYKKPILLYKGVSMPLLLSSIGTSIMFGNYDYFTKLTNNQIIGGSITGLISSFLITPFDFRKNILQTKHIYTGKPFINPYNNPYINQFNNPYSNKYNYNNYLKNILTFHNIKLYYTGLFLTISREMISIPIYFSSYKYLLESKKINAFISGGIAGVFSWFITYPIDTLKTRKQLNHNLSITQLIKLGNLYSGLNITLLRAFIVNGSGFYIYNFIKQNYNITYLS